MRACSPRARLCALLLASAASCSRHRADETAPPAVTGSDTPASSAAPPVDHLAPDELVEGTQEALGILLPRNARVEQSFVDLVRVECPCTVRGVVAYLRARLEGGGLREGTETATFEHVKPRGKPEPELAVHVAAIMGGARIEIQKVSVPAAVALPDEPARWKNVGLTPRGKVIDPTHLD